jgi:hypothetical protein
MMRPCRLAIPRPRWRSPLNTEALRIGEILHVTHMRNFRGARNFPFPGRLPMPAARVHEVEMTTPHLECRHGAGQRWGNSAPAVSTSRWRNLDTTQAAAKAAGLPHE